MGAIEYVLVDGYDALLAKIREIQKASAENKNQKNERKSVIIFFEGEKLEETGVSWCPSCVDAEPIITETIDALNRQDKAVFALPKDATVFFITCNVGPRDYWKNPSNPFKSAEDHQYFPKLRSIPSLLMLTLGADDLGSAAKCTEVLDKDEDFENVIHLTQFIVENISSV